MTTHLMNTKGLGACDHTPEEIHDLIMAAETIMRQRPQVVIEPTHVFAQGLYSRSILIPKGVRLTGKVHKQDDLQIMVYGDISVLTEDGFKRLTGHHVFRSRAGVKQIGVAHEDTLWVTVHATDETDLDRLDEVLFEDEPKIFDFGTGEVKIDVPLAFQDYEDMLHDLHVTADMVSVQSTNVLDQLAITLDGVRVGPSCIHGQGVMTKRHLMAGELVGPARVDGLRTQLGRYVNHYPHPNCKMGWLENGDIGLFTIKDIPAGEELLVDYRQSVSLVKGGAQ